MRDRVRDLAGPAVVAATLAVLAIWTWGKWPDALIDFGRELYVPWRISEGLRLYADLAYFNGPLSPSINGVLFRLVGPSLRSLVWLNLAITVAIVAMVYELLRDLAGRFVAAVGGLAFLVFFAFAQFMPGGNYSYLAPYSHEMTHGLALSLAALTCLSRHVRGGGCGWVFAAGLAAGLSFLTKAEFTIALVPALFAGLVLHDREAGTAGRSAAWFATGSALPVAAAFALLASYLPLGEALRGVAGSWVYLFDERLHGLRFYRNVQGTLDVGESLARIGAWLARYAVVFVPAALLSWVVPRDAKERHVLAGVLGVAAAAVVLVGRHERDWENLARPFPVILLAAVIALAVLLARRTVPPERRPDAILGLSFALFAFLLLLKTILKVSLVHYGFVLAMPAGMVIVGLAVGVVPKWLERRGRNGAMFRAAALGALVGFAVVQVSASHGWLSARTVQFGRGDDRFLIHERDRGFADLLARLEQVRAPSETLVVVPEGVMFNYLLRAENPTGHLNFLPPEMLMFGEANIVNAFDRNPPDWVVLVNRGVEEYGYRFFGDDYGRELFAAIEAGYEVVDRVFEIDAAGRRQPTGAILRRRPQ